MGALRAFFSFTTFSSNTECLPEIYKVTWTAKDGIPLDPIVQDTIVADSDGNLEAFAPVFDTVGTYELYIYSEAEGGASITTGTKTLELSCD